MVRDNRQIKEKDTRLTHDALANNPSAFVLENLQKLSMNVFASALMQPALQNTNNTAYKQFAK